VNRELAFCSSRTSLALPNRGQQLTTLEILWPIPRSCRQNGQQFTLGVFRDKSASRRDRMEAAGWLTERLEREGDFEVPRAIGRPFRAAIQ
jgi:hypothetical protein